MKTLDDLFDLAEQVTDGAVKVIGSTYHPDDDAEAAPTKPVVPAEAPRDSVDFLLLSETDFNWHVGIGMTSRTACEKTLLNIQHRRRPDTTATGFIKVCSGCLARLLAFQTQRNQLTDGR